ncbi:MAG: aspartate kinase [Planctomycetes bacterium]|nr:aspartate kinase [Planctomycetota bacterium]
MKVMKFGGSCLQSRSGLERMIELIREQPRPLTIVLSALKGITDHLLSLIDAAVAEQPVDLTLIRARHAEVAETLAEEARAATNTALEERFSELERVLGAIQALAEVPPTARDRVLSMGERLSVILATAHLEQEGIPAEPRVASEAGILTTQEPGDARILDRSRAEVLARFDSTADLVYVVAGFVGTDSAGRITTLGRGGSDTTATFLASVLGGPALLWKDTPGILTGDPRVVAAPKVIESLHFLDALELAHYGLPAVAGKALHPARRAGIGIEIHCFLDDTVPPTLIGDVPTSHLAISCVPEVAMIALVEAGPVASRLDTAGEEPAEPRPGQVLRALSHFLESLAQAEIAPLLLTEASPSGEASIVIRASDREAVEHALASQPLGLDTNIRNGLAAVSLIGSPMRGKVGFAAGVFACLANEGINVYSIAQTASERNISVLVDGSEAQRAVRALHTRFVE